MERTPRLFVVSGPSGVGKGTVVSQLCETNPLLGLTVSATTRHPRPGEVDGVNYYFLSSKDFEAKIAAGEFLEYAHVFGNSYGTLISEVERLFSQGKSVILEIDVQGALQVREKMPEARLVFIAPPSIEELERRLRGRATEDEETIQRRLQGAQDELTCAERYNKVLVNNELDTCVSELRAYIEEQERELS